MSSPASTSRPTQQQVYVPSETRRYALDPLNSHERHQQRFARIAESYYRRGLQPPRPKSKTELDVLKERHQFIRDTDVDQQSLSWDDQLAIKYYNSLFREFALVNLKHYKSGQTPNSSTLLRTLGRRPATNPWTL
ncbi:hypothetical protein OIO90_002470 [Microbotryomycetes sp. JL221]|nr:hypothetical protein OIO90_002470 [Microbotryomycetes sp. JL221]